LDERNVMALEKTLYFCKRDNMNFTDGAEAANVVNLTGKPEESLVEGEDFGEGVCPNCGEKGEEVGVHGWVAPAKEDK
jgi:hypothetical protein